MKEIGGYMSFEQYHRPMLHDAGIKLNSGRNALAYLIEAKRIKKICIPYFMCSSVFDLCRELDVQLRFYHVGFDFKPASIDLAADEWLYMVNYYGQLSQKDIIQFRQKYQRIIVDNAQAYFVDPVEKVDTLYTCRKFFGVADGAILFTNTMLQRALDRELSYSHMEYLFGRYEKTGSEFYEAMSKNNARFRNAPILKMSKLTENLLRSIDYNNVEERRNRNFAYLHEKLGRKNELALSVPKGAFAYPYMTTNGALLKKQLIANKIYVPTLWPNVLDECVVGTVDYRLAADLLPIPCDQRYGIEEMEYICSLINR